MNVSIVLHPDHRANASVEELEGVYDSLRRGVEAEGTARVVNFHVVGVSHPAALKPCLDVDAVLFWSPGGVNLIPRGLLEKCFARLGRLSADRRGQDLVEYALLTAALALMAVAAVAPVVEGLVNVLRHFEMLLSGG
jgi:Flp pilus assembly pilin Flp